MLTWPSALVLVVAIAPALWLARRAAGRAVPHPLWFLAPAGAPARGRRGLVRRTRLLLVAAVAALAVAAAAPIAIDRGGARVLVVDLSPTRALDVDAIRARLGGFDEVVLAVPGAPPRRLPARAAAAALVPARATVDAAELAGAVAAALPGARAIAIAPAPPPGDDAGIVAARFHRDPLVPERGRIVVELGLTGAAPPPRAVIASIGGVERGRAVPVRAGDRAVAVLPYAGTGGETLALALEPAGADPLPIDDTATLAVPALAPAPVWIDPALDGHPIARAIAVLPTAARVAEPAAHAIAIVAARGATAVASPATAPARARVVLHAPPADAPTEPLLAVPGAPLPGLTAALLAAAPPVAVDTAAAAAADPAAVWLRAGPHAAVWLDDDGDVPTLHLAAALDGAVLPIAIADALAAAPLAPAAPAAEVADVRAPAAAPPVPAPDRRHRGWPLRALLVGAAALVALESLLGRARGRAAVARAALVVGLALVAWRAIRPAPRRVVFIVDVSASMAPAEAAARAALARRAAALGPGDRAAVVVVAGGAARVVPLGPPRAIAAWADGAAIDPRARGLDPGRTDLAAGLALAGAVLGAPGGELVLVSDGHDRGGVAALRAAPALIGRGFAFAPIDAGDLARVEVRAGTLRAAPGRAFTLPIALEVRLATTVAIEVAHRGRVLARRTVAVAAGATALALPIVLDDPGVAELDVAIAVAGDPIAATDRARARVEVGRGPRRRWLTAGDAAALTPGGLAAVDAVVLDDVPGPALSAAALDALDAFVRGGGTLVWSAGPAVAAAGAGAIERWLPLRAPAAPRVALLLLVDRSGSVGAAAALGPVPGAAELAAAAAALGPDDWFGAVAFDVAPTAWIPLGPARRGQPVPSLPPPRGGTDPTAALEDAAIRLAAAPADARRIVVVVSDGGFPAAAARAAAAAAALADRGVRVEVIAAGAVDADARARLSALAAGGGRVHDLGGGLATVLPAVQRIAPRDPGPRAVHARPAWRDWLGPPPAALEGAPAARHLALAPAPDAIVLADAGDDPLLAVRAHGLGAVLAWSADLRGAWIDAALARAAATAATAAPPALALEAIAAAGTLSIRATTAIDPAAPIVAIAHADDRSHPLLLVPGAPGTLHATLAAPAHRLIIETAGARAELLLADPEYPALGADRRIDALGRPAPPGSAAQAWGAIPLLAALAIAWILALLALRR